MLKCLSFPSLEPFRHSDKAEGEDGSACSPAMGADLRSSPDRGNDFMTSASSFIKGCVLRSLSDDGGTSSVAIDNKIEQAMDLVKSHLMFAVREEVEVLKEQIKELLEKNQRLEYENDILRADASPETLAKLQSGQP